MYRINKIIWPAYLYLAILAVYWIFIEFLFVYILDKMSWLIYIFFILPVIIVIWILVLYRKHNTNGRLSHIFLYCLAPGMIFGLQMAYGLYAMGHGKNIVGAIIPFSITAIFFGIISGILGISANCFFNILNKRNAID